jgi:hypothetical protein
MVLQVVAAELDGALAPLSNGYPPLETLDPPVRNMPKAEARRPSKHTPASRFHERTQLFGTQGGYPSGMISFPHEATAVSFCLAYCGFVKWAVQESNLQPWA